MKSFLAACDGQGEAKASDPLAGAFFAPVLFRNERPIGKQPQLPISIEAFGPVSAR